MSNAVEQPQYNIIYPESFGPPTGDDTARINAAIAYSNSLNLAAGGCVSVVKFLFTYTTTSTILLPANIWLHFQFAATRVNGNFAGSRIFDSGDGTATTKANGIRISGPGSFGRVSNTQTFNPIRVYGDNFVMLQTQIITWGGGVAMYGAGNNWYHWRAGCSNSDGNVGSGGWRYAGGNYSLFDGLTVVSGDDALQFTPAGQASDPLWNISISHCRYVNCTGGSVSARFMVAILTSSINPGAMTNSITHCVFDNCHGTGGQRGVYVYNRDSNNAQAIYNIAFNNCSVDVAGSIVQSEDVKVQADTTGTLGAGVGPVRHIVFDHFTILNPVGSLRSFYVNNAEDVELTDCDLTANPSATESIVTVNVGTCNTITRGRLDLGGTAISAILNEGGAIDTRVVGTRILGVANATFAIRWTTAAGGLIRDTTITPTSGTTTSKAWSATAGSTNLRVRDNDFGALTNVPVFTDAGTGTQHSGNIGMGD